eukprot:1180499-Prorocentrum_minimum.AAC.3
MCTPLTVLYPLHVLYDSTRSLKSVLRPTFSVLTLPNYPPDGPVPPSHTVRLDSQSEVVLEALFGVSTLPNYPPDNPVPPSRTVRLDSQSKVVLEALFGVLTSPNYP